MLRHFTCEFFHDDVTSGWQNAVSEDKECLFLVFTVWHDFITVMF